MEIDERLTEEELRELCREMYPDFELDTATLEGCPRKEDGSFDLVELAAWSFENMPRRR